MVGNNRHWWRRCRGVRVVMCWMLYVLCLDVRCVVWITVGGNQATLGSSFCRILVSMETMPANVCGGHEIICTRIRSGVLRIPRPHAASRYPKMAFLPSNMPLLNSDMHWRQRTSLIFKHSVAGTMMDPSHWSGDLFVPDVKMKGECSMARRTLLAVYFPRNSKSSNKKENTSWRGVNFASGAVEPT